MATFKDVKDMKSQFEGWIHELARGEIHPEAERLLNLGNSFDPSRLIEESTIDFLTELRNHFTDFARIFNGYSDSSKRFQEVKIYSVAQTAADFMVFRNQVKLVVSNPSEGIIRMEYMKHIQGAHSGAYPKAGAADSGEKISELLAQIGPFRDVHWTYRNEKVSPDQVAKYYFIEFARSTRDTSRAQTSNQALIEQIKSLLQEKGLDL